MELKSRSGGQLATMVAGAALLVGSGAAAAASGLHQSGSAGTAASPTYVVMPAPDRYRTVAPRPNSPAPVRILIASLGVDAAVEPVGVTAGLDMATPGRSDDTGWYADGSTPGQPGDSVLDGHLDTADGAPAVFARLAEARPGDRISIALADGTQVHFAVAMVASVAYQTRPPGLFATDGPPRLTLITCSGPWDPAHGVYSKRLVVEASLSTN